MTDLDVLPRFVLVEVPQATVVAVRKPVLGHPVLLPTVAAAFSHDAGYQRRRTDVELQPLFGWTDHTRTQCLPLYCDSVFNPHKRHTNSIALNWSCYVRVYIVVFNFH